MRRRSGRAIALGLAALVAAWTFGSTAVAVVGLGLALAAVLSRAWARAAGSAVHVDRSLGGAHVEGDELLLSIAVDRPAWLPVGCVRARQALCAAGVRDVRVARGRAETVVSGIPRGRYAIEPAEVLVEDPLGLEQIELRAGDTTSLVVWPRVVELGRLFSDGGPRDQGGRRALLRRPSGFELHAVRDYQQGEPLRAVHWPSTARRSKLIVKELDDTPRDDVVVVLDQDPRGLTGMPGCSSFDAAVRAAASLLRAHAGRGKTAALVLTGGDGPTLLRVRSLARDWPRALDALAEAEADAHGPLTAVLGDRRLLAGRAPELVVVTSCPDGVADVLAGLRLDGRHVALVVVDAATFGGAAPGRAAPPLLRASAAGVDVAVVRAGEDLAHALSGTVTGRASA